MSIKTYLKAAAIALPMAIGGGKAAAQTANTTVKVAERTIAADTLKAMEQKANTVKIYIMRGSKPQTQAPVAEQATQMASNVTKGATNFNAKVDGTFVAAQNLESVGYQLGGEMIAKNNAFKAKALLSTEPSHKVLMGDVAYERIFPVAKDLGATGSVGLQGVMHKIPAGDSYGQLNPRITAGLKYAHEFKGGAKVGAKAEVGGAQPFNFKLQSGKATDPMKVVVNAELEAGYKGVTGFVNGGRDAVLGNNVGAGVRVTL